MMPDKLLPSASSIRRNLAVGNALVLLIAGGVGGWAATTRISGAVVASGTLVASSNVKLVQHPTGGIIGQILARNGDHVVVGQVLARLDDTMTRATFAIIEKSIIEMTVRKARLEAERDGRAVIEVPVKLAARSAEPDFMSALEGEKKLFVLRRSARDGQREQLGKRIEQLNEEISGLGAQRSAKAREIELIGRDLKGARDLFAQNLMPITKMTALEREATRLDGEHGQILSSLAQVKGKISETELQIIQIQRDLGTEVGRELRDIDAKLGEFVERRVAAEDQFQRVNIRAPQNGIVFQSTAHTVGGVIQPGEKIMSIVPDEESLTVEAKISPNDIDQLHFNQHTGLRFSAFNQQTTPELDGKICQIAADATVDGPGGSSYFAVRISMLSAEVAKLGNVRLVPGMPVEVFIKTGDRTVLSYIVKPLSDQIERAFRES